MARKKLKPKRKTVEKSDLRVVIVSLGYSIALKKEASHSEEASFLKRLT